MRRNTLFECTDVLKINSKKKFKKILKKPLTKTRKCGILIFVSFDAGYAGIAQLAEQLICNQQVVGSSPITSSTSEQAIYRLLWFFFAKNQSALMPLLLLYRKRSHLRRLFSCKRLHNTFGSLPTFCEAAPAAQISLWFVFPTAVQEIACSVLFYRITV